MSGLSRPDRRHVTAGVDPTIYYDFQPGQRVMTREGIAGTVTAVEDGPYAGSEQYLVELDAGLGGGAYSPGELRSMEGTTAHKTAVWVDTPESLRLQDEASMAQSLVNPAMEWVDDDDLHTAASDYPELGSILVDRPDHQHAIPVTAHKKMIPVTAGPLEWMGDKWQKGVNKRLPEDMRYNPETNWSVDWCRFRKDERCMYPKFLDVDGTRAAGYIVWKPEDRGHCPRHGWDQQKACPVAEPGPHSKDPRAMVDATVPWSEGGQRGGTESEEVRKKYPRMSALQKEAYAWPDGTSLSLADKVRIGHEHGFMPAPELAPFQEFSVKDQTKLANDIRQVLFEMAMRGELKLDSTPHTDDPDAGAPGDWVGDYSDAIRQRTPVAAAFEFTAGWKDIQQKAKRIRGDGGVQIISASPAFVVAYVQGDTDRYETRLQYEGASKRLAMWECGCDWALYSWGRSGRWKKYEGRMCSHALALQYEASARGMFGREVQEDKTPNSLAQTPAVTPGERRTKPRPFRVGAAHGEDYWDGYELGQEDAEAGEPNRYIDRQMDPEDQALTSGWVQGYLDGYASLGQKSGMRKVSTDPILNVAPAALIAEGMLSQGEDPNVVMAMFGEKITRIALTMSVPNLRALVRGIVRKVKNIFAEDRVAEVEGLGEVPVTEVIYPTYHPTLGLDYNLDIPHHGVLHEAEADTAGVMVCVRPPDHVCEALVGLGTEDFDNLHVTLAYLGKTPGVDHDKLHMIVSEVADQFPQLMGTVGGFGLFLNGEGNVVVALIDSPGLEDVQVHLTDALQRAGLPVHGDHGYTPHLTLSYTDGTPNVPKEVPAEAAGSWPISDLIVSYGDEWVNFPMTGLAKAASLEAEAGAAEGLDADHVRSFQGRDVPDTGETVAVYRDLSGAPKSGYPQDESWSIKRMGPGGGRSGLVYAHTMGLRIVGAKPVFDEAARRKFMESGTRGVHAYIGGVVDDYVSPGTRGQVEISYFPDLGTFFDKTSRREFLGANEVIFAGGHCWANGASLGAVVPPSPKFEPDLYAQWSQKAAAAPRIRMYRSDDLGMTLCPKCFNREPLAEDEQDLWRPIRADDPSIGPGSIEVCSDCGRTIVNSLPRDEYGVRGVKEADWAGFIADEPDPFEFEGAEAELKPTPEGALPEVTAEDPPAWEKWEPIAEDDPDADPDIAHGERSSMVASLTPSGESATIRHTSYLEESDAPLTTGAPPEASRSWLMAGGGASSGGGGPSDGDIASRARQVLAMKAFSPAEQAQLINEGEGVTASNLDRLDISGTHYEALEAALETESAEEDDLWLGV